MNSSGTRPMTRRHWTALLSALPLLGQVTSKVPPQGARPSSDSATPEQKIQKANADLRKISDRLAQIEVPMNIEPAFSFRP